MKRRLNFENVDMFVFIVLTIVSFVCTTIYIYKQDHPSKAPTVISKTHQESEMTNYGYKPSLYIIQIEKEDGSKENIFVSELDYSLAIIGEEYNGD